MPSGASDKVIPYLARSICKVEAAFSKFAEEARSIGLAVNESKTKYPVSAAKDSSIRESVEIHGYNFEVVKDFVYLGSSINTDNDISLEIRRRITLANRCYFGLRKQLSKRAFSWRTKICLYKSLILSILLYGAETWTMTSQMYSKGKSYVRLMDLSVIEENGAYDLTRSCTIYTMTST